MQALRDTYREYDDLRFELYLDYVEPDPDQRRPACVGLFFQVQPLDSRRSSKVRDLKSDFGQIHDFLNVYLRYLDPPKSLLRSPEDFKRILGDPYEIFANQLARESADFWKFASHGFSLHSVIAVNAKHPSFSGRRPGSTIRISDLRPSANENISTNSSQTPRAVRRLLAHNQSSSTTTAMTAKMSMLSRIGVRICIVLPARQSWNLSRTLSGASKARNRASRRTQKIRTLSCMMMLNPRSKCPRRERANGSVQLADMIPRAQISAS